MKSLCLVMEFIKLKNFQGIPYNRKNSAVKFTQFKTELFAIANIFTIRVDLDALDVTCEY